jgi:hypothetical protein
MTSGTRRGGVGTGSGRALLQAGIVCLVAAGCAADPPPALLMLVDAQRLVFQDSPLLSDSAKVSIRTYIGRTGDDAWVDVRTPSMDSLVGAAPGTMAVLNPAVLPQPGKTRTVTIDVPGTGPTPFRLTHVEDDSSAAETYTGQAKDAPIAILLIRDSITVGRITVADGDFNFRSKRFGFIAIAPLDTSGALPALHLIRDKPQPARTTASDDCVVRTVSRIAQTGPC